MELPNKIKVLAMDYTVKAMTTNEAASKGRYGECDSNLLEIRIDPQWKPQKKAETLLHEMLHAISNSMALDASEFKSDEDMVHPMASGLAAVIRDNPKTFQAIVKALR